MGLASGHCDREAKLQPPPVNEGEEELSPEIAIPASIFFGWITRFFLVGNMFLVWLGYWFMYGQWPGSLKLWLCSAMGIVALIWAVMVWRRTTKWHREVLTDKPKPIRAFIPVTYAIGLVGMLLVEAIFVTWVVWGPPEMGG